MVEMNNKASTEMHTFLPNDNPKDELTTKYKVQVLPKDPESAVSLTDPRRFDPFAERKVDSPTSDCDTLTHLLKASLGTGILAMPCAFRNSGLVLGVFMTIFVSLVCTHCSYILVKCAHILYTETRKTQMSYAEVVEAALQTGPKALRKLSTASKYFVQWSLFITYFGTCSAYTVIIADSFKEVLDFHLYPPITVNMTMNETLSNGTDIEIIKTMTISSGETNLQMLVACLLLPLIILMAIPNLKVLAPISMVANVFMATSLGITFYYLVMNINNLADIPMAENIMKLPKFFSLTIFALEAIGVVMPLENNMKTPQHFVGICGVLNKGMGGVTLIYIILGFLGYSAYPNSEKDLVTGDLDIHLIPAQVCKVLIGLAVYCTFGLQFFVCLDIAWASIKDHFSKKPMLANYILRLIMVVACVGLAVAVPTISPFMGLIGAFCFSILGLLVPVFLETITYWNVGFGRFNWVHIKNVIITLVGIAALIFGSKDSLEAIIKVYTKK